MLKTEIKEYFKTYEAAAKFLGITSGAISQWPERIEQNWAARLAADTNGKLKYDRTLYEKKSG